MSDEPIILYFSMLGLISFILYHHHKTKRCVICEKIIWPWQRNFNPLSHVSCRNISRYVVFYLKGELK